MKIRFCKPTFRLSLPGGEALAGQKTHERSAQQPLIMMVAGLTVFALSGWYWQATSSEDRLKLSEYQLALDRMKLASQIIPNTVALAGRGVAIHRDDVEAQVYEIARYASLLTANNEMVRRFFPVGHAGRDPLNQLSVAAGKKMVAVNEAGGLVLREAAHVDRYLAAEKRFTVLQADVYRHVEAVNGRMPEALFDVAAEARRYRSSPTSAEASATYVRGMLEEFVTHSRLNGYPRMAELERVTAELAGNSETFITLRKSATTIAASGMEAIQALRGINRVIDESRLEAIADRHQWFALGSAGLAALMLAGIIFVIVKHEKARLARLAREGRNKEHAIISLFQEILRIGDGDLTVEADIANAYTGAIADALNVTVAQWRGLIGTIKRNAESVAGNASTAAGLSETMKHSAAEQTREISRASDSLHEIVVGTEDVVRVVEQTVATGRQSQATIERSMQSTRDVIEGMSQINAAIGANVKLLQRLSDRSREIGEVTQLLSALSEQISVLSMNADVESSRAGEAGRGFRVVASEIQKLSARTEEALDRIANIVKSVQADTHDAIRAVEATATVVTEKAEHAGAAGRMLGNIGEATGNLLDGISSIRRVAENQKTSAENLATQVDRVVAIVQATDSLITEVSDTARLLRDTSSALTNEISSFKIESAAT